MQDYQKRFLQFKQPFPPSLLRHGTACITSEQIESARTKEIDTRLPLVADYSGAMVNVSIKSNIAAEQRVDFYAPVFPGVSYRIAAPVADYISAFQAALPPTNAELVFSCNCILNYLYCDLEGKQTGKVKGPITFGEIGYQLLNQTLVYLTIEG